MIRRRSLILALIGVLMGALVAYGVTRRSGSDPSSPSPSTGTAGAAGRPPGPVSLSGAEVAALAKRVATPRHENFYFVMTDRFANGEKANDRGGLSGDRVTTGFDPTDKGFFHGGDLAGLQGKLDYIKGLGTTAIWLTPSFVNRPVQGSGEDASAGYHGYWITDFTRIDPHLGTNDEMTALIAAAHAKGMKVYFDIVTNHTADVIDYESGTYSYVSKADSPYQDAAGKSFDDAEVADRAGFPALSAATSFPYVPIFRSAADAEAKTPSWLNDRTLYHNRGNSTFEGESSTYGDFGGLDDLFTENPKVLDGMIAIYEKWIDFGIDGFRIDTVKHVNLDFWRKFGPALMAHARAAGRDEFFMFGEVYDTSPAVMSLYSTTGRLPGTLDFGFQSAAVDFVSGHSAQLLSKLYAADDTYLDADSNAYVVTTFLGNHDMGRIGSFLVGAADDDDDLLQRDKLAMSLMYLTRGQPVTYYGDEQGFVGWGGDKDARQDLFKTRVEQYAADRIIGGHPGARDRYDTDVPLYQHIAALTDLRADNPALATGIQIERYAADGEGVYAFSRIDRDSGVEYLVAANNAKEEQRVSVPTASPGIAFASLLGGAGAQAGADGKLEMVVPARAVTVLKAGAAVPKASAAPPVTVAGGTGGTLNGQAKVTATLAGDLPAEVTFAIRKQGSADWRVLGTDDNAAYGLYIDTGSLSAGSYDIVAVARTLDGQTSYGSMTAKVAAPQSDGAEVIAAGSFQDEAGCPGDWQPECAATALTDPDGDGTFTLKLTSLPKGDYEFKIAIGGSWAENYGADGAKDGANIPFSVPGDTAPVTLTYDSATHNATALAP
ncbi:alpha-amylase family glycosyl hydrolase [Nostocoides vanveenii]|uniref:Glycosyl hydrolase family 13 catalytic domain-containing protein n=1 Tax=Nostocoides vanveenii TaxID=330835 RepID=A0ABP4X775_9MICO